MVKAAAAYWEKLTAKKIIECINELPVTRISQTIAFGLDFG